MREVMCLGCGDRVDRLRAGEDDPHCLRCGGLLKSATISFGQSLVAADLIRAEAAALACDLLLAVGSTLTVSPACNLVDVAAAAGAPVVIVNAQPTPYDAIADAVIRAPISEVLPRLVV
jgi:NAD-dependent deacetylase